MGNNIFDWKDAKTWDHVVKKGLTNCIGKSYAKTLKANAESIEYVDCEDDGCALFSAYASQDSQIACVIEEVERRFGEMTVYHACRTNEPASYYEKGILPLSPGWPIIFIALLITLKRRELLDAAACLPGIIFDGRWAGERRYT